MPTTGPLKLLIDGEYDMVTRASQDVDALREAHQTPITKRAAEAMLHDLCAMAGIDFASVAWRWAKNARGQAGTRHVYRREVRLSYQRSDGTTKHCYRRIYVRTSLCMTLPTRAGERTETGGWYLRVGLVLHEFTHMVLAHVGDSRLVNLASHGPLFTWLLDGLVAEWKSTRQEPVSTQTREEIAA